MRWKIIKKFKIQNSKFKIEDILNILLKNRGIRTQKQRKEFLNPSRPESLSSKDVGISSLQLNKAIGRIKKAIKDKEKVVIYGDYDADGVCATAILWETLYRLNKNVMPFIPTREEGYGMKMARVEQFASEGVVLLITVDQGIVALEPAKKAKELGMDLVITDHHVSGKSFPKALSIIHTEQLSGSGVAWFLANQLGGKDILDLAAIGTVGDVVPLLGPNRTMAKFGLEAVRKTKRPGLLSLYESAAIQKEKIGTYEIGFIVGPRLNASGRMDDPVDSLRLICTKDKDRAGQLAQKLEGNNMKRQLLMEELTNQARELWLSEDGKSGLIFVAHEVFQRGVMGLVAGKLMEEFYRPVIVVWKDKLVSRGSARSIEEFNIVEAIRSCEDILQSHGGHPRAAGFTVETQKIEVLRKRLIQIAEEKLDKEKLTPTLKVDIELSLTDLNIDLYEEIKKMEPFGEANPQPVFASRKIQAIEARLVGAESQHLKLRIASPVSRITFDAIGFGMGVIYPQLSPEKPIDIAYNLILNEWNGNKRLELKLRDIKI